MTSDPQPSTRAFADDERTARFVARTWASLAALGAGLVLVALGAEHVSPHAAVGAGLLALAAAVGGWALAAMRGTLLVPRTAMGVLLVGGVGWVVVAPAVGTLGTAELTASGLQLLAAILVAVALRSDGPVTGRARPLGRLGVAAFGALAVSLLTVPGLAATSAGAHAVPHGSHGLTLFGGAAGHAGHGG